jgi:hypothetical protein
MPGAPYFVEYGPDTNYGQHTQTVDIGATQGAHNLAVTLTRLSPNSPYHFDVIASNAVEANVHSGDTQFNTGQQITGVEGSPVTVTDSGSAGFCPAPPTIDWGDNTSPDQARIDCMDGSEDETDYQVTDTHTYTSAGHYQIEIDYGELGTTTEYAQITNESGLVNTELPEISGTTQQGHTLTTTDGSWDGNPIRFHYQWEDCDPNGHNCTATGDDTNSYTLTADDGGQTIRVIVTASNDHGSSEATSDETPSVLPPPPASTAPPQVTGTAQQGATLTTTNGTWDGDPTSFVYRWQDCDASGQNCANTLTNANTYPLTAADVGHTVHVIVTANNDFGSGEATSNLTAQVVAPSPPPPSNPPPSSGSSPSGNPAPPTVATTAPTLSVTGAGFSGTVTPNGLPTQAFFEYGLDPKYSGGGPIVYDQSTPAQSIGSDFASHAIGPVAVSGLLPNALYHARLVATNSNGTTFGPDVTFTTAAAPAPGAPTLGKTVNVSPVSGFVLIKINGKFVPLTGLDQIPSGSQIDARHGSIELITSTGQKGKTQHGTFGGAIFRLTQERSGPNKGLVTLTLLEGAFKGAPSYPICKKQQAGDASVAAVSSKVLQLLHASAHGKFRTSGRYSAATVRGTIWMVADRCDGTLTHDVTDSVVVKDFVHHKTIILHAGQSYLARPRH